MKRVIAVELGPRRPLFTTNPCVMIRARKIVSRARRGDANVPRLSPRPSPRWWGRLKRGAGRKS